MLTAKKYSRLSSRLNQPAGDQNRHCERSEAISHSDVALLIQIAPLSGAMRRAVRNDGIQVMRHQTCLLRHSARALHIFSTATRRKRARRPVLKHRIPPAYSFFEFPADIPTQKKRSKSRPCMTPMPGPQRSASRNPTGRARAMQGERLCSALPYCESCSLVLGMDCSPWGRISRRMRER